MSSEKAPDQETTAPVKRLCSEIQLFDLCDLERCKFKDGRFCLNPQLLERFEQIADVDDSVRNHGYVDEEDDADEGGFGENNYNLADDEDEIWDDE